MIELSVVHSKFVYLKFVTHPYLSNFSIVILVCHGQICPFLSYYQASWCTKMHKCNRQNKTFFKKIKCWNFKLIQSYKTLLHYVTQAMPNSTRPVFFLQRSSTTLQLNRERTSFSNWLFNIRYLFILIWADYYQLINLKSLFVTLFYF